jgi:hypothetical protein
MGDQPTTGPTADPAELPPVVAELRRELDALAAPYGEAIAVSHHFDADPDFDPQSEGWPADHAWITLLDPTVQGQWIKIYFDGIDRDLTLTIDDVGYFEWWDHSDLNSVVGEVAGICAGVMAGDIWEWRTPRERGCEVLAPDGRRWRVTDGRRPAKYWPRWGLRPVPRRRLDGYVG